MAKRHFHLTESEQQQVRQAAAQSRDVREVQRLQAVRLYGEGRALTEVAAIVAASPRSIQRWCSAYQAAGVTGLKSGWQGGNAAKLTPEQRAEVKQRLQGYRPDQIVPPDLRVSQGTFWTVSDLRVAVQQWYGVVWQSDNSYRSLLKASGFSLQRAERQYRSRPDEQAIADFEARLEKK